MLLTDRKWFAFQYALLRTDLFTFAASDTDVRDLEPFLRYFRPADRKALPVYRALPKIKKLNLSLFHTEWLQNISALPRIYVVHRRIHLEDPIDPLLLIRQPVHRS